MAELKTKKTKANPEDFIKKLSNDKQKEDSFVILNMMKKLTKDEPKMWGDSLIGFGDYRYRYASGREGDWFKIGFSPRKQNFSIYLTCDISKYESYLKKLGKYKTGKGCLYINKLEDINIKELENLIKIVLKNSKETQSQN